MLNTTEKTNRPDAKKIQSMFNEISGKYDQANSVLSGGIHHLWRKKVVAWSQASKGQKVLDCATGTGDLAIEFAKSTGDNTVIGTDFSPGMLKLAPQKAKDKKIEIKFELADVTKLPYEDNTFDIASISFGIRNVNDPVKAINELARVIKPSGTLMILEFGQPSLIGFRSIYNFYSTKILPTIGGWVTGKKNAYKYLQDSSANFPCRNEFVDLMNSTGNPTSNFKSVEYKTLSGGIAYIYKATVLPTTGTTH